MYYKNYEHTPFVYFGKGVMETLGNQLKQLEEEIKMDEAGKMEFERLLAQVGCTGSSPRDETSRDETN